MIIKRIDSHDDIILEMYNSGYTTKFEYNYGEETIFCFSEMTNGKTYNETVNDLTFVRIINDILKRYHTMLNDQQRRIFDDFVTFISNQMMLNKFYVGIDFWSE